MDINLVITSDDLNNVWHNATLSPTQHLTACFKLTASIGVASMLHYDQMYGVLEPSLRRGLQKLTLHWKQVDGTMNNWHHSHDNMITCPVKLQAREGFCVSMWNRYGHTFPLFNGEEWNGMEWLTQLATWLSLALLTLSVFSLEFHSKGVTPNWAGAASQCIRNVKISVNGLLR